MFTSRLKIMSLKRKYDFDQIKSSSTSCPDDDSLTTKYIKTDEFFNDNSRSSDERKFEIDFRNLVIQKLTHRNR